MRLSSSRVPFHLPFAVLISCASLGAAPVQAAVSVIASAADPQRSLFPSDRFTVLDVTQETFRRVNLPNPACAERPSDCADIDVVNTLDGFNLQPRLSIPFDG